MVIRIGEGDHAIVGGVVRGGVEDAVQPQQARFLIQFIFIFSALGDLDNGNKAGWRYPCRIHIVPRALKIPCIHQENPF